MNCLVHCEVVFLALGSMTSFSFLLPGAVVLLCSERNKLRANVSEHWQRNLAAPNDPDYLYDTLWYFKVSNSIKIATYCMARRKKSLKSYHGSVFRLVMRVTSVIDENVQGYWSWSSKESPQYQESTRVSQSPTLYKTKAEATLGGSRSRGHCGQDQDKQQRAVYIILDSSLLVNIIKQQQQ